MKTSPFAPWTDSSPDSASDATSSLLQQAAEQLSEAAARLSSTETPSPGTPALSLQITVATPSGDPLPFTFEAGPDLTLL